MPSKNIFTRLVASVTGSPTTTAIIAERLTEARANAIHAEQAYRRAAHQAMQGEPDANEEGAEIALGMARREITRLEAIMIEVRADERERERLTLLERQAAEDERVIVALGARTAAAKKLAASIQAYVRDYVALADADEVARGLQLTNGRVRQDLLRLSAPDLVSREITRVSPGKRLPPGGSAMAAVFGDPTQLPALATIIAEEARVIREGLSAGAKEAA